MHVDLGKYSAGNFDRGASRLVELAWIVASQCLFRWCPLSLSSLKCAVLRMFGAKIGKGVVIKPQVKITFPWKLSIGDHVWLGEECWLLNLEKITIGNNVCISQRAMLCTGSHNYKVPTFDLMVKPITVEDGGWIGSAAWVGPGVTVGTHAVLTAGSVAARNLEAWNIYQGNPADFLRTRTIDFRETPR
jgi:putative colanic acid biosynthesis acetyltransferase WcaF